MGLAAGTRIAHYEIRSTLGAGGMGPARPTIPRKISIRPGPPTTRRSRSSLDGAALVMWVVPSGGGEARRVTSDGGDGEPEWFPDGFRREAWEAHLESGNGRPISLLSTGTKPWPRSGSWTSFRTANAYGAIPCGIRAAICSLASARNRICAFWSALGLPVQPMSWP